MKAPSIRETAFSCPHCGAFTTQYWHNTYVSFIRGSSQVPFIPTDGFEEKIQQMNEWDTETKRKWTEQFRKIRSKLVFTDEETDYGDKPALHNLFASQCYNCKKWAISVHEDMLYPSKKFGPLPNQDLPEDVLAVVEEARGIIGLSAKGAAALLRLAIQMLCKHLGESGKNLNADISSLVKKGLNPIVQKSLDVVRVIGNESVHPGEIDLNDDRETAERLFDLINVIADQMITQPKHVDKLYEKLPQSKKDAIDKRDETAS